MPTMQNNAIDTAITVDAFGRPLEFNDSVFDNFTRLVSSPQGKGALIAADFNHYKCENIQLEEMDDDLNAWEKMQAAPAEAKENLLNAERAFLRKMASGEFLAHHLPYQDLASKKTIQVLEENGSVAEYTVQKLQATHNGLVGYVLIPTTADTDSVLNLKVVFQGTASLAGVERDVFEAGGAGAETFQENSVSILSQVEEIVAHYKKATTVTTAGHSLGSSDAQNFMAALMEAIAKKQGALDQIRLIKLFGCNSPGIPAETNERAKALAKFFKQNQTPLELECNYLRIHRDGVQQTGETTLLNDVSAEYAKVEVMKVASVEKYTYTALAKRAAIVGTAATIGVVSAPVLSVGIAAGVALGITAVGGINTADAHTQHVFNPNAPEHFEYERYSNQDLSAKNKVDVKKSAALNSAHRGLLTAVDRLKDFGASVASMFKNSPKSTDESKPVLFSPAAQAAASAQPVPKPVAVENQKKTNSFWQRLRGAVK